jgi:membrane protease YdiL (CAAX protease family)
MAPAAPTRASRWREVAILYGITLAVTVGLTVAQGSVGWLRGYVLVLVAATFLYLPIEVLHRKGEDPADLGIHRRQLPKALRWALLVMLLTFPPYLVGFHGWQVWWLGNDAAVSEARFDRWPVELEDPPKVERLAEGEVRLFSAGRDLWLRWRLPGGQAFAARVKSDAPVVVRAGRVQPRPAQSEGFELQGRSEGQVVFRAPGHSLSVDLDAGGDRLPAGRLRLGTALVAADEMPYRAERSWWWILNLILVQVLLVALPEEVFYRGYLQTRLEGLVGRDRRILGVPVNVSALVLTSALFAVGHFLTIPSPQRLAVFFPSLLFGWLRRASGGVAAGVLYHAACNILVELASRFYAG